jgi:splicing factor 3A subunit 3
MRALGLPNTKHFHEITKIEDALARESYFFFVFYFLWCLVQLTPAPPVAERLKQEGRKEIFDQETMEELEDDEGNVYNKKTWEDLKKQGLI